MGSDDGVCVGGGASNGAVSSRDNPTRVMNPATAEMCVGSGAHRSLVGKLSWGRISASNNTTLPILEDLASGNG